MQDPNVSNLIIKIDVRKNSDYTIVSFDGDLDKLGLELIRQQIDELVENLETTYLIYDFANLNFINSEGIGYIITIYYRLLKKEKILVIVNASAHVKDVLQVIGINEMVKLYDDLKAFTEAINKTT